ncbi:MAG: hypothetical protein ACFB21_15810 [Opitutales bacterium]
MCLSIVARFRPQWLVVTVKEAAEDHGFRPERICRLTTRLGAPIERLVERLTRRGRPPVEDAGDDAALPELEAELSIVRSLLGVAGNLLQARRVFGPHCRAIAVGAYLRLKDLPGLSQKRFCDTLGISPRTLRHWLKTTPKTQGEPAPRPSRPSRQPPEKRRKRNKRQFTFNTVLPDTQYAADTTCVEVLGVPLKIMGVQDVGGRDVDLLDGFTISGNECAAQIATLYEVTLSGVSGAQMITDQGTPYLAAQSSDALDQLEIEHAIQPEGTPTAKATIERAFGTLKSTAEPVLDLLRQLAAAVPALSTPAIAVPLATAVFGALLSAYRSGARARDRAVRQRASISAADIEEVAQRQRERARSEIQSRRLLLIHVHETCGIHDMCRKRFLRAFRSLSLDVLQTSANILADTIQTKQIERPAAYFGGIVRRLHKDHADRRAVSARDKAAERERQAHDQAVEDERSTWRALPELALRDALALVRAAWNETERELLYVEPATYWLRAALFRLHELRGSAAHDIAQATFRDFCKLHSHDLEPVALDALKAHFHRHLDDVIPLPSSVLLPSQAAILFSNHQRRPPPTVTC